MTFNLISRTANTLVSAAFLTFGFQTLAAEFTALGPAVPNFETRLRFELTGLEPLQASTVLIARKSPEGPKKVFLSEVTVTADATGKARLDEALVEKALNRTLMPEEKAAAGYMALAFMENSDAAKADPALLAELQAQPSDRVLIRATSRATGQSIHFSQELLAASPNVTVEAIDSAKFQIDGKVYRNKNNVGRGPTVVLWGGSGGTYNEGWAQYLAHQGFNVVSIRYFSQDPNEPAVKNGSINYLIRELPLEIFERAIIWAKNQDFTDPNRVSIMGESRGGEAALVIAQYLGNELRLESVIANRPLASTIGNKITGTAYNDTHEHASWTFRGKPLPFAAFSPGELQIPSAWELTEKFNGPLKFVNKNGIMIPLVYNKYVFLHKMDLSTSKIDVTKFNGRIMTIAGSEDPMWPSADAVKEIRRQRQGRVGDSHVIVEGAGHVTFPGITPDRMGPNYFTTFFGPITAEALAKKQVAAILAGGTNSKSDAIYSLINMQSAVNSLKGRSRQLPFIEYTREKRNKAGSCKDLFRY